jgi:nicotinamide phosphoribosyltransferase
MAMKATWGVVDGEPRDIFKDPKTDDGTKKSAKGLLHVYKDEEGRYRLKDQATPAEEASGELEVVFENGKLVKDYTLAEVRANFEASL